VPNQALRIKRVDSPLRSSRPPQPETPDHTPEDQPTVEADTAPDSPGTTTRRAEPKTDTSNGANTTKTSQRRSASKNQRRSKSRQSDDRLGDPPALDEQLEFVSGRVPSSLANRLNLMTQAVRERQSSRASQKGLPQQEVLAVLLWALGDPDDPENVNALLDLHARYRARRYAQAAQSLEGSSSRES
jgi:hypothetical protein